MTANAATTILVVDDDHDLRQITAFLLTRAGAVVLEAETLAQAQATLATDQVDAAIVDVNLPDGLGTDLRADLDGRRVLFTSAVSGPEAARMAREAGVEAIETKPLPASRIAAFVEET